MKQYNNSDKKLKEIFDKWIENKDEADKSKEYGNQIKSKLYKNHDNKILKQIWESRDILTKKSIWSVGGDEIGRASCRERV